MHQCLVDKNGNLDIGFNIALIVYLIFKGIIILTQFLQFNLSIQSISRINVAIFKRLQTIATYFDN